MKSSPGTFCTPCRTFFHSPQEVWLLQFYLPNLTGNGGIDNPKQFGASTFHTLVVKYGVF